MRPRPNPIGPNQESVWDYPRPPRAVETSDRIVIEHGGQVIVDTRHAWKVMETASPPTYYVKKSDVERGVLVQGEGRSWCEWKGRATYWDLQVPDVPAVPSVAWSYEAPNPKWTMLTDHVAFYPGRVDRCLLAGEQVRPQPGQFYGGWVTDAIVGPFKGEPGTQGW